MRWQRGFTLVEMVMALVILGFISLAIGSYLQLGTQGYVDTVNRDRAQSIARFALEKITREVRHAAPNSISTSNFGTCLSFYPVRYSGFYQGNPDSAAMSLVPAIGSATEWKAINAQAGLALAIGLPSAMEYEAKRDQNKINSVADGTEQGELTVNLAASPVYSSPAKRAYVYGDKVEYCLAGNLLTRQGNRIAEDVKSVEFVVEGAGLQNNGMVHISLVIEKANTGEAFSYNHTVQVINVL
ncbi:PilW family protein [Photobacterium alginatilyticum]|uniref:Prepilin-type N-terminal cleavage/methylation domain-containing protein n=1 Tax=Photobacterium alginatilyticum TaxID=1775171 RepID=A0ABW9YIQ4_9GAMM|nr:prepilin-type N-terminal cleavage/methylation domain-containing protein [Photobacterium alginatilyticum]NBI53623.1 prepilin-type N-terminal cleavage/methylation domain-containing protein [Photobacterium alginatilyticum]